jgi:uncharacterized protein (TIGR03086 family)
MTSELLTRAAAPAVVVVAGIDDTQLDLPTPCAKFTVRELLNHLFQVVVNFQSLARREAADWSGTPDALTGDWRHRFAGEAAKLVEAWSDPSAMEGVSPGMGLPQETVRNMVLLDLTVHAWDLARATGQPFTGDAEAVSAVHGLVLQMGPMAREQGVFGDEVPVPEGADELATVLARSGRDPHWTPA